LSIFSDYFGGLMQFAGKQGIAVFVLSILSVGSVGFGSGLLVGRHFPVHRFQKFGETRYVIDSTTGKICDPFHDPHGNPIDQALADPSAPKNADGFQIVKPVSYFPAPCGE